MTKGFTEHWMETCEREKRPFYHGFNPIRISAEAFAKMNEYKNKLTGKHKSLLEASREYEKKLEREAEKQAKAELKRLNGAKSC